MVVLTCVAGLVCRFELNGTFYEAVLSMNAQTGELVAGWRMRWPRRGRWNGWNGTWFFSTEDLDNNLVIVLLPGLTRNGFEENFVVGSFRGMWMRRLIITQRQIADGDDESEWVVISIDGYDDEA